MKNTHPALVAMDADCIVSRIAYLVELALETGGNVLDMIYREFCFYPEALDIASNLMDA